MLERRKSIVGGRFWRTRMMGECYPCMQIWYGRAIRMLLELRITLIKLLKLPLMTGKSLISFMLNLRNKDLLLLWINWVVLLLCCSYVLASYARFLWDAEEEEEEEEEEMDHEVEDGTSKTLPVTASFFHGAPLAASSWKLSLCISLVS